MRTILFLLQKEFIQVSRNRIMLPIMFIIPIVQLLILVNAATFEVKKARVHLVDMDLSPSSRLLTGKFDGSPFFNITASSFSYQQGLDEIFGNQVDMILQIPEGFEKSLVQGKPKALGLTVNAVNAVAANLIYAYSNQIISQFARENIEISIDRSMMGNPTEINVPVSFWFNPELNYRIYMLPGILVVLVTLIGQFLTALNIVREKEMGTIEQVNVTPIRKHEFIIGKLVPFWIIGMIEFSFGLLIGWLFFKLPIAGSLWALYGFVAIYLVAALSMGLFIAAISNTQPQVMFTAFFINITFIMMSGIFTPAESMPFWAQKVNVINPLAYFMKINRMVLLKGSGMADIWYEVLVMTLFAVGLLFLAKWKYKKTS